MNWQRTLVSVALTATLCFFAETPSEASSSPPELAPPEVDTDSLTASIRLREGLRILERYESFKLFTDERGVIVETEPEPADSIRLDAMGWENGPGMQSWLFRLPQEPEI